MRTRNVTAWGDPVGVPHAAIAARSNTGRSVRVTTRVARAASRAVTLTMRGLAPSGRSRRTLAAGTAEFEGKSIACSLPVCFRFASAARLAPQPVRTGTWVLKVVDQDAGQVPTKGGDALWGDQVRDGGLGAGRPGEARDLLRPALPAGCEGGEVGAVLEGNP